MTVSFDALSEDPSPLKRGVLLNRRPFMVRVMASAKINGEGGCGHVKNNILSVMRQPSDEHVLVQTRHFDSLQIKERVTPTSFWDSLQSAERVYSMDAGSTVTCVPHGETTESRSVGCQQDHFFCGRVVSTPVLLYNIPALKRVQELVDPSKRALVCEDRPITDSCLRSGTSDGRRSFF